MKSWITLIFCAINLMIFGQTKIDKLTSQIVEEGKLLYRSEMASWYGTDMLFAQLSNKQEQVEGYFSYSEGDISRCIFYTAGENPKVTISIRFDSTYNMSNTIIDTLERAFTDYEYEIYTVRKKAIAEVEKDTMFIQYNNTSFNFIPLITPKEKKVFVLTGPKVSGVVVLGNDYVLRFDKKNKLKSKTKLHKNIIPIEYKNDTSENNGVTSVHTHLPETGDFITSTDICTLMLYGKYTSWQQHITLSDNYVCIWYFSREKLVTLTRKAWDKIAKDQQTRNGDQ